ncbi:MAG: CoA transferase, partial [Sphaerobacter thermophilus]
LADQPGFRTNAERVTNRADVVATVGAIMAQRTTAEWMELLERAGVPAGPINTVEQILHDPHVLAREMVVTLQHPTAGEVKTVGIPAKLSDTPGTVRSAPPLLGQHTDEVLAELGYDAAAIADLRERGIV